MELGLGNSLFKNRALNLFPRQGLQVIVYNQTYEEEGTTYLRTSIGVGIPKVSGTGLDTIWDFSVLNDDRFDKSNATYWGATLGDWFYYNELNPYHGKMKDFHYRYLENQIESQGNTIFAKIIYDKLNGLQEVNKILVYSETLIGNNLSKVKNYCKIYLYNTIFYYQNEYDDELISYNNELTTALSSNQVSLLDIFIKDIKSGLEINNLSDIFDIMYILANETEESSLLNLVKRAHDAIAINSPQFNKYEGFTGDGVSSLIDTNYNLKNDSINFSLDNNYSAVYFRTINTNSSLIGIRESTYLNAFSQGDTVLGRRIYNNSSQYSSYSEQDITLGLRANLRNNIQKLYINQNEISILNFISEGIPNGNYYLLGYKDLDNLTTFYMNNQQSFFVIGKYLTLNEHKIIVNAFEKYMDANDKGVI